MQEHTGSPLRIVVIGAGVAGCLVTQSLLQTPGAEVICIEKGDEKNELAGTALNVGPNALKVLQQVFPTLAEKLYAESLLWSSWKAGLTDGTVLFDRSLLDVADNPGIRIRWSELYQILRANLLSYVRYHTTVIEMGYSESQTAPLFVTTRNQLTGETEKIDRIDLIVACDGRYSQVRETFFGTPQPEHLGVCLYRLLAPNRSDRLIDDYQQWFHQGSRLLTFAIPGDEIYIAGSFPIEKGGEIPPEAKTTAFLRSVYQSAKGYSEVCQFLVDTVCDNIDRIHWARLQEIPTVFRDRRGHVLCLGDSSHAMVPTLGQGATQAFEDGCFFAVYVRQILAQANLQKRAVPIPALTAQIEAARRDRVEFVKTFSREASQSLLAGSNPAIELQSWNQNPFLTKLKQLYRGTFQQDTFQQDNFQQETSYQATFAVHNSADSSSW
ncbi:FAD-dependent oxidoreductase [Leptolyngbya ohadii]|uniref:FAD-dependent oxidoreductase n=1 Tax=Leptolyngbya ohadii TaxID=1962290 RepID=UPI000B59B026|nr:NAD(P)/FAD-dependent oxidoreductase [Leptolyngbya ohadii]